MQLYKKDFIALAYVLKDTMDYMCKKGHEEKEARDIILHLIGELVPILKENGLINNQDFTKFFNTATGNVVDKVI